MVSALSTPFVMLSPMSADVVIPPDKITVTSRSLQMSTSNFIMEEEGRVIDIACILAHQAGLEENVDAAESLAADAMQIKENVRPRVISTLEKNERRLAVGDLEWQ